MCELLRIPWDAVPRRDSRIMHALNAYAAAKYDRIATSIRHAAGSLLTTSRLSGGSQGEPTDAMQRAAPAVNRRSAAAGTRSGPRRGTGPQPLRHPRHGAALSARQPGGAVPQYHSMLTWQGRADKASVFAHIGSRSPSQSDWEGVLRAVLQVGSRAAMGGSQGQDRDAFDVAMADGVEFIMLRRHK